ncbi:MAG: TIGR03085 family metal-binding protein [Nocardioides sp.]
MGKTPLARRERHDLCDLAIILGEDAPTLCGDWTTQDLVAHLLVRENRPLASLGIAIGPLSGLADRAMARVCRQDFGVLVEKLRDPGLTAYRLRPVEVIGNTLEYFVHHEDLRRAQPGWEPRELDRADTDALWSSIRLAGRLLARPGGVPLRIRRADTGATATLVRGRDAVTVTGPVSELVLFLFGRRELRNLEYDGPAGNVALLRGADLGF